MGLADRFHETTTKRPKKQQKTTRHKEEQREDRNDVENDAHYGREGAQELNTNRRNKNNTRECKWKTTKQKTETRKPHHPTEAKPKQHDNVTTETYHDLNKGDSET